MKRLFLIIGSVLALAACTTAPTTPVGSLPGASQVCTAINGSTFDTVLKSYGAATDAINLLIDTKVITPGSSKAVAIANGNDKVLAAFAVAEQARQACNAASFGAALQNAQTALAEIRAALHK